MKIQGKKLAGPNVEVIVFPRQDGNIVFKAQAVLRYDEFNELCPVPNPPKKLLPGDGGEVEDPQNPEYVKARAEWAQRKTDWMILTSLAATDDLEWDEVDLQNPDTWAQYNEELRAAGFTEYDIMRLLNTVTQANGLDQDRIDEATKAFLASLQGRTDDESTRKDEPENS